MGFRVRYYEDWVMSFYIFDQFLLDFVFGIVLNVDYMFIMFVISN